MVFRFSNAFFIKNKFFNTKAYIYSRFNSLKKTDFMEQNNSLFVKNYTNKNLFLSDLFKRNINRKALPSNFNNSSESNIAVGKITYEEIGLFPRSFNRVFDRFLKQVFSDVENLVLQEYRFYRYLFLTTLKTLFLLFFVPFLVNLVAKSYLIRPLTEYLWNTKQPEIFLNSYQQKRAFAELHNFEETLFFESLITFPKKPLFSINIPTQQAGLVIPTKSELPNSNISSNKEKEFALPLPSSSIVDKNTFNLQDIYNNDNNKLMTAKNENSYLQKNEDKVVIIPIYNGITQKNVEYLDFYKEQTNKLSFKDKENYSLLINNSNAFSGTINTKEDIILDSTQKLQQKTIELAMWYNKNSIEAITNILSDFLSFLTLIYLLISLEIQINVTKSFLLEIFFGLEDSKKSLFILLITDLLVGYHSPNIWEFFFEFIFNHYGIPESQTVIFLLVATLPVLLDVLFKYLIFRHLNRSSPATVATYHAMIE